MSDSFQYTALAEALRDIRAAAGPSEAHGLLCGMLCGAGAVELGSWLQEVLGAGPREDDPRLGEVKAQLQALADTTTATLQQGEFGLELELPPDSQPLDERLAALAAWCQGFLAGFGMGTPGEQLSPEVQEVVADMIEIGKADPESADEGEDLEQSYTELVEYVRVGVQSIYEEIRQQKDAESRLH